MVPNGAQGQIGCLVQVARLPHRYPMRRLAPFSATSSPMDKPGRFGYLHTSFSTLSHSDVLSGVEITISRDLLQSQQARLRRAHWRSRQIATSTPDSTSEWLSVESEVFRYPKRPGSSIGDAVAENGAIPRTGSNRVFGRKSLELLHCRYLRIGQFSQPGFIFIFLTQVKTCSHHCEHK